MTRLNFNTLTPYAVGFDRVFDRLLEMDQPHPNNQGFPPYNIRREDEMFYIDLALAGLSDQDLQSSPLGTSRLPILAILANIYIEGYHLKNSLDVSISRMILKYTVQSLLTVCLLLHWNALSQKKKDPRRLPSILQSLRKAKRIFWQGNIRGPPRPPTLIKELYYGITR